jgi:hypothetical protein
MGQKMAQSYGSWSTDQENEEMAPTKWCLEQVKDLNMEDILYCKEYTAFLNQIYLL